MQSNRRINNPRYYKTIAQKFFAYFLQDKRETTGLPYGLYEAGIKQKQNNQP